MGTVGTGTASNSATGYPAVFGNFYWGARHQMLYTAAELTAMGFIGGKADQPAPITEKEADAILRRVDDSIEKPKPKTIFEPGEMVRVIDGPFNDFNGVVEEVNYDKNKLRVAVLIFGRSTPVELEFSQVEKT